MVNTNGGFMKKFTQNKQKWILTASLLAVLSMNYQYQSSSQESGSFEFASKSPAAAAPANETETLNESYLKDLKEKAQSKKEDDRDAEMSRILRSKSVKTTQAASTEPGACTAGDCKTEAAPYTRLLTADLAKLFAKIESQDKTISDLQGQIASNKGSVAAKPETKKEESSDKPENCNDLKSRSEKRECLAEQKRDKEREKQEDRVAKFEDKMEDVKDKCDKDIQCLTTEFTAALSKFDGRNSIPQATVNKYFKQLIAGPLAKSLFAEGGTSYETVELLNTLMNDIPSTYGDLKKITMDSVRYQAMTPARKVNEGYKLTQDLSKQNNPQAYFQQLAQTQEDHRTLNSMVSAYSGVIESSIRETGDSSAFAYYQKSYMPNMQKLLSTIMNPTGLDQSIPANDPSAQQQQQVSNSSRTTRTQLNTNTSGQAPQLGQDARIMNTQYQGRTGQPATTLNNNGQQWQFQNQNQGFQQSAPSTTTRGGRGRY